MTRTVRWTLSALGDLDAGLVYLAERDETAARRLREKVTASVDRLARYPIGRPSRIAGHFEKPVTGTRYTIFYIVDDDTLIVARLIHQRRNWPDAGEPSTD